MADGLPWRSGTESASEARLRPALMTALVASLGFVPLALNTEIGASVRRSLPSVVIEGILSSVLLTVLVVPALYNLSGGPSAPGVPGGKDPVLNSPMGLSERALRA